MKRFLAALAHDDVYMPLQIVLVPVLIMLLGATVS